MKAHLPALARVSLALLAGVAGLALMDFVLGVVVDLFVSYSLSRPNTRHLLAYWWVAQTASAVIGGLVAFLMGLVLALVLGRNRAQLSVSLLLGFNVATVVASSMVRPDSVPALLGVFYTTPIFWTFQLGCLLGIWLGSRPRSRVV